MAISLYFLVIIGLAVHIAFNGEILSGLALAGGVLLAMAAGGGARISWELGRRNVAVVIGLVLLFIGMTVTNWAGVTYDILGFGFYPDLLAFVGSVLAFFAPPRDSRDVNTASQIGDGTD